MKAIWIVSILIVSGLSGAVALAADGCVQQATNYELIQELNRRLSGTGPVTGGSINVSFTCGGNAEVKATAINLTTGTSTSISNYTGDWDRCRKTADLLNSKLGGNAINGGRVYAICGGNAQVFKNAILSDGTLKQVAADYTGDWALCYKTADQINASIQP